MHCISPTLLRRAFQLFYSLPRVGKSQQVGGYGLNWATLILIAGLRVYDMPAVSLIHVSLLSRYNSYSKLLQHLHASSCPKVKINQNDSAFLIWLGIVVSLSLTNFPFKFGQSMLIFYETGTRYLKFRWEWSSETPFLPEMDPEGAPGHQFGS